MTTNEFFISFVWGSRADSPAEIGHRMLRSLDALSSISPIFQPWWLPDFEAEAMVPLEDAVARMTEIVESGVTRDDDGDPEPENGYRAMAQNREGATPQTVGFRVKDGDGTSFFRFGNNAVFETEFQQIPDPAIITYPIFKAIILTLAPIWDVAYARACSSELTALWTQPSPRFDVAWMTYLSVPLAAQIVPPKSVLTERVPGGGLLLIAAEETFDAANPRHMTASRAISEALAPLNDPEDRWRG